MYKQNKMQKSTIVVNEAVEGESIEMKMQRIVSNKEPISGDVTLNYTERREGVLPGYDPRTDKWDEAIEAQDKRAALKLEQRKERLEKLKEKENPKEKDDTKIENEGTSDNSGN